MQDVNGHSYLRLLRKQWIGYALASALLISFGGAALAVAIAGKFVSLSVWLIVPIALGIFILSTLWLGFHRIRIQDIARLLNQNYPQLEESAELLIKPDSSLNIFERLQAGKIESQLRHVSISSLVSKRLKYSALLLISGLVLAFAVSTLTFDPGSKTNTLKITNPAPAVPDKILPGISSVDVRIDPPAYTRRRSRKQSQFSLTAEEGSLLGWTIRTSLPVKSMSLIFNDQESVPLRQVNEGGTLWSISKRLIRSGFYQVNLEGTLSDLYKLEMIKDQAAQIRILAPQQYSSIDFGEPQRTRLRVQINDDYGISNAFISATISSGQGEGVKFREQKLAFDQIFSGASAYTLNKTIDLKKLGMVPGDELYFYVQARDSRLQDSRSDIYIVTIQDTAQLMSMEGMLGGVNLVPEYFRSQRQIIIDTEKLLKDKNVISLQEFNNKSNDIGVDQKLLRLRYGKFLGEEDESEIGGHEEHESDPADFGNPEAILDAVSHKHDVAEDATFFEPELKAQLKATLTEMWKSELQLRTYKPAEALPFEYKALRLLKDLQQKSRVYVAKTSFKPPVIKADKRLSGELDKITQPQIVQTLKNKQNGQNSLKVTAAILVQIKEGNKLTAAQILTLNEAATTLAAYAAAQPSFYLTLLARLRSIIRAGNIKTTSVADLNGLEGALQQIIKQESRSPQSKSSAPSTRLASEYFNNLKSNR